MTVRERIEETLRAVKSRQQEGAPSFTMYIGPAQALLEGWLEMEKLIDDHIQKSWEYEQEHERTLASVRKKLGALL